MRALILVAYSIWSSVQVTAKPRTSQAFPAYHSDYLSTPPLRLGDTSYDSLTAEPRNHTLIVLLTALDARFGCQLCKDFQPEWDILAKSSVKADPRGSNRVVYGTLDFADGKGTFQKLMLQTAPIVLLFTPSVGPDSRHDSQPLRYDFTSGPQSAEQIYSWIQRHRPGNPQLTIRRPVNYVRVLAITTIALGLASFFSVAYPYVLPFLQNRNLWAAVSLITILLFTSGHMFNHIRKVPYVAGDGKGGISYFAGGFSNQFGMETQIVAAMYGVLSFATIALALKVPRIVEAKRQQIAVFAWGLVLFSMYSFLLSVFRTKNAGYPFSLPPF